MASDLEKLIKFLEVQRIDKYLFLGKSPPMPPRIFGGQVLAQSLSAANRTVDEDRLAHSMHAYFLRPGNPEKQIVYEVQPLRDGKSFTTRSVIAKQDGIPIFNTSVSFQVSEEGLEHQSTAPAVTPPETLESDYDYWLRMAEEYPDRVKPPMGHPIERKPVNRRDYLNPEPREPEQEIWFKALGDVGDDFGRHQTLLAFMSDFALLGAALLPHPYSGMSKNMQAASLDHAIWFHRPFKADEHLLYVMDSPSATAGRGFSRGSFYTQAGVLVASTAQEALIRVRES